MICHSKTLQEEELRVLGATTALKCIQRHVIGCTGISLVCMPAAGKGGAEERQVVWVRGPHLAAANGVLLARRRLLTSRQALFTYPDAEQTRIEAVSADATSVVSAPCLPGQCLLMNQTVEFSVVSIPASFSESSGVRPVTLARDSGGAVQPVRPGDTVLIATNTGGRAARGCTAVGWLMVDDVTDSELWLHAIEAGVQAEVGSPVFLGGHFVAIVVALPTQGSGSEGLRALRIEAIMERLSKRSQLEDAFDNAPAMRFNSDGHARVLVPASARAAAPQQHVCVVTPLGPIDQLHRALSVGLTPGAVAHQTNVEEASTPQLTRVSKPGTYGLGRRGLVVAGFAAIIVLFAFKQR